MSGRLGGDGGVDDSNIRDGGIDSPGVRDPSVDNPDIRAGVDNPDIRAGVDNPEIAPPPQAMSGGLPLIPIAIVVGVVVVGIAAFSLLQPGPTAPPGASPGTQATRAVPGATNAVPGATTGVVAPGATSGGPAADDTANLVVTGTDVSGSWTLDGGADVSPTTALIAAVWAETVDNVAEGYGDFITLSMGGTIVEGTQPTAEAGLTMGFVVSRYDAAGAELFNHVFSSRAGECQVTMARTSTGVSGTFNCASITDADGHTVSATGSFAT